MDKVNNPHKKNLGKEITLTGSAENSKMGAVLNGDNFTIYIEGLTQWPDDLLLSEKPLKLTVSGILIEKYDLPVFVRKKGDPIISGIEVPRGTDLKKASHRFLLQNARWNLITESE